MVALVAQQAEHQIDTFPVWLGINMSPCGVALVETVAVQAKGSTLVIRTPPVPRKVAKVVKRTTILLVRIPPRQAGTHGNGEWGIATKQYESGQGLFT